MEAVLPATNNQNTTNIANHKRSSVGGGLPTRDKQYKHPKPGKPQTELRGWGLSLPQKQFKHAKPPQTIKGAPWTEAFVSATNIPTTHPAMQTIIGAPRMEDLPAAKFQSLQVLQAEKGAPRAEAVLPATNIQNTSNPAHHKRSAAAGGSPSRRKHFIRHKHCKPQKRSSAR